MAYLYGTNAKEYAASRPSYPPSLFEFIASKTVGRDLAWDAGTGTGQAAIQLAGIFNKVVATDRSEQQLSFASKLPNIRYKQTPPNMSKSELELNVAAQGSVNLVTVAQAVHWFDLPEFYQQVKWVIKKPNGVIAVWCYGQPEVNEVVDAMLAKLYKDAEDYWSPYVKPVADKYATIEFPFEPVEGMDGTGPFQHVMEKAIDLDGYLTYIRTRSLYLAAIENGVELLNKDVIDNFVGGWAAEDEGGKHKVQNVRFPVHLRIGKVGTDA